jgi:hypothetical protein
MRGVYFTTDDGIRRRTREMSEETKPWANQKKKKENREKKMLKLSPTTSER